MDSDIPSIYFPIGKLEDGGSCAFASKKCLEHCPSGMKTNVHEQYALDFFKNKSSKEIVDKIVEDFNFLISRPYNARMIQWFAWGDCLPGMEKKVYCVMATLMFKGIPQYGFTRNKKLWERVPKKDRLSIGLTVEDIEEAYRISLESKKMTACPDFDSGYAQMIFNGKITAKCNGWWCITNLETRNSDCSRCLSHAEGCYADSGGKERSV
jgi:hypothetical protein